MGATILGQAPQPVGALVCVRSTYLVLLLNLVGRIAFPQSPGVLGPVER